MSKTKDNWSNIAVFFSVLFVSMIICLAKPSSSIMAADHGKLEIKTVHSYEEMEEAFDGDDAFYSFSGNSHSQFQYEKTPFSDIDIVYGKEKYVSEYTEQINEIWQIEIEEPGWLVICDFNDFLRKYDGYNGGNLFYKYKEQNACFTYLYTNKLQTKPVNRVSELAKQLSGQYYKWLDCERYYVQKGTYYLSYSGGTNDNTHCLLSAVFLPAKDIVSVKKIEYNDDYTEVVVYFSVASNNWSLAGSTKGKIDSDKALGDQSYWSNYATNPPSYPDYSKEKVEEFNEVISKGWRITENGEYSLYYKNGKGVLADYEGIVTFTIDKIGSDASDIEAKSIKLNKKKAALKKGDSITLKATIKPAETTDKTLSWTSSNSKVATVDENGNVTAKKKGTCTITAISSNGKKAKCKITVKKS